MSDNLARSATPEDTQGILDLVSEVYAEYGLVLDAEEDEPNLLRASEYFQSSGGNIWVVEDGGKIRATVAVSLSGNTAELKTLYVHKSLRRHGLGRRLIELAASHARHAGKTEMILWSDTRFTDAHRLYRNCGFTQNGERELHDFNESSEYGFEKSLTTP